jgi:SAM-dependent methyltransferase
MNLVDFRSWNLVKFNSSDPLDDCIAELAAVMSMPVGQAGFLLKMVLKHYTLRTGPYPEGMCRSLFNFLVAISSSLRIPVMTTKMDWVIDQLSKTEGLRSVLDYGAGGGRDCIFYSKLGYSVTHADFVSGLTPYVRRRFAVRGMDVTMQDVRDLKDERYDIVNCMDVLEHIYDMEYALADICARLKMGGRLFVFPNFVNSWNGDHVEKNCAYLPFFETLVIAAGLRLVDKTPVNGQVFMYHFVKPFESSIGVQEEREELLPRLYKFSAIQSHAAAVIASEKFSVNRLGDPSEMIDNYSVYRLCRQRLGGKL